MKVTVRKGEIYEWKCSECGKTISSLYIKQLKTLVAAHKAKHEELEVGGKESEHE